ncbi:MAG: MFS transporter [Thermodesulfobacteriota bacterium]
METRRVKTNYGIVGLVFLIFFVISLLTNILGPLLPDLIAGFRLSLGLAGFLPFSLFFAYGVMSIPSGMLVERCGERAVIVAAFLVALAGSGAFALVPRFPAGLASLFLIGIGMAMLQVAINPLLRAAGGERHFAFNSVTAQLIFGLASFASPRVYVYLVNNLNGYAGGGNPMIAFLARMVPPEMPWVSLYWLFTVVTLTMALVSLAARIPSVGFTEQERVGAWATYAILLKDRRVRLYFLGIFCYVGTEQGLANWISKFLQTYHGLDPRSIGALVVSAFWGLMTAGCLAGLVLLKVFDSRAVLVGAAVSALAALSLALFGTASQSLLAFPLMGLCASVMWSIIFSLALNSMERHHGNFSGILCTAVIGGAVVPVVIGWLGDLFGLRQGMTLLYIPLAYILSIGFWARPLVSNATIRWKTAEKRATN